MLHYENNENIELEYHASSKTLEVRWLRPLNQDTFTSLWDTIITVVNKHEVENIVLDSTFVTGKREKIQYETRLQQSYPHRLGLPTVKKIAWVRSGNTPYDYEKANHYYKMIKDNFPYIQFESFAHHYEALYWIE